MDLVTGTDLEELAQGDREGTHLSLFMPTKRAGDDARGNPIRWKNLLTSLNPVLAERGLRRPEIEELLAPAWALYDDDSAWQRMSDGLAMFLRPGRHRIFRVPTHLPELATFGERFIVGPLLRILSGDEHFLLLTVSQRRMRLLEGNRQRVEELELDEVPTDLRETIEAPEPRTDTMARSVSPTGRGGPAVFYGHGAADGHYKKDEVRRFLRQVAGGLREYLVTQDLPMVLVGLDQLVAAYREVNDYPHVTEEAVRQNPDQLSDEELHASAWPVIAAELTERRRQAVERFKELHGTGRATDNNLEIGDAAAHGRVETLFLAADPWCWEEPGTDSPTVVPLGADDKFAHCEQLDRAAIDTLSRRGQVYAVPEQVVPGGGDVAAVLRY